LNPPPPDRSSDPTINWHREKRSNETHESLTDAMARLYKKTRGAEAKLGYLGHVLTENRNGLVIDVRLTQASGTAEREAAEAMISGNARWRRATLGGDRGCDTRGFVASMRELNVTPHVAQNDTNRRSAIDNRTTRHEGYALSQRKRKRVEEVFGWIKTIALQRKTRFRGLERVGWMFTLAASAYNLVRMRNLQAFPDAPGYAGSPAEAPVPSRTLSTSAHLLPAQHHASKRNSCPKANRQSHGGAAR
jgi:hypothetical protein